MICLPADRTAYAAGFIAGSDVEADVQDVAVLDDVRLALEPLRAAPGSLGVGSGSDEVVGGDHLAADEPARDVRVDRSRRLERRLAGAKGSRRASSPFSPAVKNVIRPRDSRAAARLSSSADGPSRNSAALLLGELRELRLQPPVDALRTVLHREERLGGRVARARTGAPSASPRA